MLPSRHLLVSLIVVAFLFPFYSYWSFAFLIGGFLIDVDHYFWYVVRFRDFNLKKAYIYSLPGKRRERDILHVFHVWEFWVLMFILAFFNSFFTLVAMGLFFHIILDLIELSFHLEWFNLRAYSFFGWLKRHPRA